MKKQRQKTDSQLKAEILKKHGGIPEGELETYWKTVGEKRAFYGSNKKISVVVPAKKEEKGSCGDGTVEMKNTI